MNGYLLDTSVLSAFAPDRPPVPQPLRDWIIEQGARETLFTSAIVIAEIQRGIAKLRRAGGAARLHRMEAWLAAMLDQFGGRIIAVDVVVGREAGELNDAMMARGRQPGLADVLIAATARVHQLEVLTANIRHFAVLDVPHFNPLQGKLP